MFGPRKDGGGGETFVLRLDGVDSGFTTGERGMDGEVREDDDARLLEHRASRRKVSWTRSRTSVISIVRGALQTGVRASPTSTFARRSEDSSNRPERVFG